VSGDARDTKGDTVAAVAVAAAASESLELVLLVLELVVLVEMLLLDTRINSCDGTEAMV